MKILFYLLFFLIISSCSNSKNVYWCGDHACKNNKEKVLFFKEHMIVEVKDLGVKKKRMSEIEMISQQALFSKKELKRIKKIEKKDSKTKQKEIEKDKKLVKKIANDGNKNDESFFSKIMKSNKKKKLKVNNKKSLVENNTDNFNQIVKKITKKNELKKYPDINIVDE